MVCWSIVSVQGTPAVPVGSEAASYVILRRRLRQLSLVVNRQTNAGNTGSQLPYLRVPQQ
ncbi:hypothetical protein VP1G_03236 [Cytospora mali]|uniref:Uncharacterized protein n=1 Tax=Cytospora mali TaxID=578113 RepID=A0A194UVX4_CYTMA|nr:hypothetical protein VP1G_03236 [Valsa mali var. pyri (nom. inval.)]